MRADLPPHHASQPDLLEVMRAADRAASLVRQLLAFAGGSRRARAASRLNQGARPHVHAAASSARKSAAIDIEPALWSVQVDVAQLETGHRQPAGQRPRRHPAAGTIVISARNAQVAGAEARVLG